MPSSSWMSTVIAVSQVYRMFVSGPHEIVCVQVFLLNRIFLMIFLWENLWHVGKRWSWNVVIDHVMAKTRPVPFSLLAMLVHHFSFKNKELRIHHLFWGLRLVWLLKTFVPSSSFLAFPTNLPRVYHERILTFDSFWVRRRQDIFCWFRTWFFWTTGRRIFGTCI